MLERLQEPVAFFLLIMTIILVTPLLSERLRLPGIVGIILGGMLIGPYGLGLLEAGDRMVFLSTIGLVYLMFSAGLEVDIQQFIRVRGRALVFGVITFALPQVLGIGLGILLGLTPLGSILLGSAFASHTLIAFPILYRIGVTRNEAVAVTAGATVLTDIGAFIILAVVLGAKSGDLEFGYFIRLFGLLSLFTAVVIIGLPRLGKFFFQRFSGRAIEFQFVIVVLFVAALGAELIGVHEVVGAFLAGLAINATLPRHSPVTSHVLFMGESFFIPVFLLYSGMITNPRSFLTSRETVLIALGVTIVAYLSKFIAAWITSHLFKYTRAELWTVFGLSHAQAAVTIPTLVIGLETGLFSTELFNAAILMILLTSITSPLLVQRFGAGLLMSTETETTPTLFERILVPVTEAQAQENMVALAALLVKGVQGKLMAVSVARDSGRNGNNLTFHRDLLDKIPEILNDPDLDIELIPRLAGSHAQGILHTASERNASLIVMGWRGKPSQQKSLLGTVLDEVIWGSNTPVMVSRLHLPLNGVRRLVFVLPSKIIPPQVLHRMLDTCLAIAKALNVTMTILADRSYLQQVAALLARLDDDRIATLEQLKGQLQSRRLEDADISDLIVVPGFGSRQRFASNVGHLPERIAEAFDGNLLILHFDR